MLLASCVFSQQSAGVSSMKFQPNWDSLDSRAIPDWFEDAKFGIFIHWGVYSVPSWIRVTEGKYASYAEWYQARVMGELRGEELFHEQNYGGDFEYRDFAPMFKAELFDPGFWAEMFSESGARYVVLTAKHHDGYCLWPTESKYKENWNSMDVGPKRDLVGDLTSAVRAKGMRMGLYYSMIEWETSLTGRTPSGRYIDESIMEKYGIPRDKYVDDHVLPQLKELVEKYQPALIFSDGGEWDEEDEYWKTKEFLAWLYNNAPNRDEVVVNDRWAKGMPGHHGDYYSSEYQDTEAVGASHPWEESRGMGRSYGFNRAENINHYQTSRQLIHELIDIVSRGGNLLLNVGPTADGRIPVIMQQRLRDIGAWLKINGEAIFETRAWSPGRSDESGGGSASENRVLYTRKGSTLFVFCLRWPEDELEVPGLDRPSQVKVTLLGSTEAVQHQVRGNTVV
ncbi:MAG: alpha-L-fucosidase, partial [bacterium]|nr:alpha-L-fucosidase [bacterium]